MLKQRTFKFGGGHEYVSKGRREEQQGRKSMQDFQETKRSKAATKSQTSSASHSREVPNAVSRAVVVLHKA